jgi:hypothetical protein
MTKINLLALVLIAFFLLVIGFLLYPLIVLGISDPKLLVDQLLKVAGVFTSLVGLIMFLPKKTLITFFALFESETLLKNQQFYGSQNPSIYSWDLLSVMQKLNSFKWSKPVGLILFVIGIVPVIKFL